MVSTTNATLKFTGDQSENKNPNIDKYISATLDKDLKGIENHTPPLIDKQPTDIGFDSGNISQYLNSCYLKTKTLRFIQLRIAIEADTIKFLRINGES